MAAAGSVLVIATNQQIYAPYAGLLEDAGYQLFYLESETSGFNQAGDVLPPDLLIVDLEDDREGLERISRIRRRYAKPPMIVLSERDDWTQAVAAMKAGANEYLRKPLDLESFRATLRKVLTPGAHQFSEKDFTQNEERYSLAGLIGNGSAMKKVHDLIRRVAETDATVLILGESGTGKELVSRVIHHHSRRAGFSFVAINCGAIPADLLESELFGHEKGAFTGAIASRKGRFELAARGTLFLDEIAEMSPQMQVKLLRVLQERTFERIGGMRSMQADVRVIAATHRNLEENMAASQFREDLFYRLNVFPITLPPLRERKEDIPELIQHALARLAAEGRGQVALTDSAMEVLMRYPWPGNVRELQNIIERLVILYPDERVDVAQLPPKLKPDMPETVLLRRLDDPLPQDFRLDSNPCLPVGPFDLKQYLENIERELIQQALSASEGIVARAATRLNLRRTTLVEKIKKLGMRINDQNLLQE